MARGFITLLTFLVLATLPGLGQIVFPGGGGGYPGQRRNRYPGGQQGPNTSTQDNSSTITGILRKIEDKDVIVEADDKTITTITTGGSTKYIGSSGGNAKIGDFQPGDHVKVSANQDSKNVYHAVRMTMVSEGTADEHSIASVAADDPTRPLPDRPSEGSSSSANTSSNQPASNPSGAATGSNSAGKPTLRRAASSSDDSASTSSNNSSRSTSNSSSSSPGTNDDDPDRPRLRRASSSSSDNTLSNSSPSNSAGNSSSASSSSTSDSSPSSSETVSRRRRAVSSSDDGTPRAQIAQGDSATTNAPSSQNSSSDSDRPVLRRSTPSSDSNPVVADARPSLHAADSNGVTRLPSAPQPGASEGGGRIAPSGDDFIDQVREAAFSFSETLPNYVVKQFTTRYGTVATRGGRSNWQVLDNVTADVIEEDGNEKYKNILVNGKPPVRDVEKTGSWSRGEFSSLQLDVLSPVTNADFHGKRSTTIVNRAAFRYEFNVQQPNSHWHMEAEGQSYQPAYTGSIWIDKENFRVLRIELSAVNLPRSYPLDQVESAVDYDYVLIGDGKYLLPTHSEALSCAHSSNSCTRNVIEFRNYKKFTADTSITFDDGK